VLGLRYLEINSQRTKLYTPLIRVVRYTVILLNSSYSNFKILENSYKERFMRVELYETINTMLLTLSNLVLSEFPLQKPFL
jgi:hypothetical protein